MDNVSTKGALRVATWTGLGDLLFLAESILTYSKAEPIRIAPLVTFVLVFTVFGVGAVRQIARLDQTRTSKSSAAVSMFVGGGVVAAVTVLGYLRIGPQIDFYLYVGLVLWTTVVFVASCVVEWRHNVRLYLALEGLIVRSSAQ